MKADSELPTAIAIIQARMGSSRLPGKVLLDIAGQPMLKRVIERSCRATTIDQVIIATTDQPSDDPIAALCEKSGYPYYRGSMHDVLDRYYQTARLYDPDLIVRITADCPLIDPQVADRTVLAFLGETQPQDRVLHADQQNQAISDSRVVPTRNDPANTSLLYDFAANRLPPPWGRTFPIGLDTEVCSFESLQTAWEEAQQPYQREHVMPFFYDHLDRFRVLLVHNEKDYGSLRWTVDTPEDLDFIRQVFAHFPDRDNFSWLEVLALLESHPELSAINAHIPAKDYRQVG